jgi:hypothetical protein
VVIWRGDIILTGKVKHVALDGSDLLVDAIDNLDHVVDGLLAATVHLEQNTLKGLAFNIVGITVASQRSRTAQELSQSVELLAQCFLGGLGCVRNGVSTDSFQFLFVRLGKLGLLGSQTLFILGSKLFVVGDLLFSLGNGSLESRFLQVLGLLVVVDLLLLDELVKRLSRVFGEDGIDFGAGILKRRSS